MSQTKVISCSSAKLYYSRDRCLSVYIVAIGETPKDGRLIPWKNFGLFFISASDRTNTTICTLPIGIPIGIPIEEINSGRGYKILIEARVHTSLKISM